MDSPSDPKRALITGIGGFTGRYVRRALQAEGYAVYGTTHVDDVPETRVHPVDLRDQSELQKVVADIAPSVVVHLAAVAFVAHGNADEIYEVNLVGSRHLLESLANLQSRPRAVILASSANVYGNADVSVLDESVPPNPQNDYAVSKLAMEHMARIWCDRLPIVVARPFNYTGVGQPSHFLLPKIVDHFRRREPVIELGNMDVERDFSDVRTVAAIYTALVRKPPVGRILNVCSGKTVSLRQVLATMGEIAGYQIEPRVNPAFVRRNEVQRLRGDPSALETAIGPWESIPIRQTLKWMYEQSD